MTDNRPKLLIIAGPTASGKSSLAIDLALNFGGEIVNSDSMQVYRGMDIGTAKPSISERAGVPHHLIDVVDPDEEFNASIYRSLAEPLLKEIAARQNVCFVVGGTGLYIKTLLGGLLECPPSDPKIREKLSREYEEHGSIVLHERLKRFDLESARSIHPHDKTRIIRALEIIKLTNQTLSSLIQKHAFKEMNFQTLKICLHMEREQLYQRINARSLAMIEAGLVEEVQSLLGKGYSPELNAMRSLGYRHVMRFLGGEWALDKAISQIQTDTRKYAKRQLTWFKGDPEMVWLKPEDRRLINAKIREFI